MLAKAQAHVQCVDIEIFDYRWDDRKHKKKRESRNQAMIKYIIKRVIMIFPILLGVVFMVYAIMEFTPGDPALRKLGNDAPPEAIEQLREEMGLNKSFPERFVKYIWDIVTKFDFGESWRSGNPV